MGFGNPEPEYSKTRHNVGFDAVNYISEKYNIEIKKKEFDSLMGSGIIKGEKVILMKPQTYMNESGKAVIQAMNFYKLPIENLIVIYDDIDIDEGIVKIRKKGGPGTHNGMRSLMEYLNNVIFRELELVLGNLFLKNYLFNMLLRNLMMKNIKYMFQRLKKRVMQQWILLKKVLI